MEITQVIISGEIGKMIKQYSKLEDCFKNSLPERKEITNTIKEFLKMPKGKIYPDLAVGNPWLNEYSKGSAIYMFFVNGFTKNKNETEAEFDELSKAPDGEKISLCRINDSDKWEDVKTDAPICLYVGSSLDIKQRLKEHLFLCNQTTYAMHLEAWFDKESPITIYIWDFKEFLSCDSDGKLEYLQKIEDLLWNHYKPLFGRQGKK